MPKVIPSSRRTRALHQSQPSSCDAPPHSSYGPHSTAINVLWTSPRKVSFEDGHQSSSSFSSASATAPSSASTSSNSIASSTAAAAAATLPLASSSSLSCKSSLRRKAPSACLVGLAQQQQSCGEPSAQQRQCLSPSPSSDMQDDYNEFCHNSPQQQQQQHGQNTTPSSPWGHFVDILVPLDEDQKQSAVPDSGFFGFLQVPDVDDEADGYDTAPYFPNSTSKRSVISSSHKRHKHRRCSPSPHPYALLPRHPRQRTLLRRTSPPKRSFLPGFLVEPEVMLDDPLVMEDDSRTTELSEAAPPTHDEDVVARALQRLQV